MNQQQASTIARWLAESNSAVAFTGAGISTESGIPDFRSPGGVWTKMQPIDFDDFIGSEQWRYEYWKRKADGHGSFDDKVPNIGHKVLASWESIEKLRGVITQNVDGLHQDAGNQGVLELHGTVRHVACLTCNARYSPDEMVERFRRDDRPPTCDQCGGITKHGTISFGQSLPADVLQEAARWASEADLFFAIGSSLVVHPAASLPVMAHRAGARLVIINREPTPIDEIADEIIRESIGEVLQEIDRHVQDRVA